jgi:transposase
MQDRASAHTSAETTAFLRGHCPILSDRLPNSPDLIAIEMIWAIMKMGVKRAAPQMKELQQVIKTVWNELDDGLLTQLVSSFLNLMLSNPN